MKESTQPVMERGVQMSGRLEGKAAIITMEKMLIDATPIARRGTPENIANVYAFLASDEASWRLRE